MRNRRDNEREFYMGDSFNRGATMYFCSPDEATISAKAYDDDTCFADSIASLDCSISALNNWSAQGTSSTTYATANCVSDLTSSIDAIQAATSKVAVSAESVGKALKMIGDRLGMSFDENGNLEPFGKMNFKVGALNRLKRRDLKTLKGNY